MRRRQYSVFSAATLIATLAPQALAAAADVAETDGAGKSPSATNWDNNPQTDSRAESIDRLINELSDADFLRRRAAQARLLRHGKAALSAVDRATRSSEPELALQARRLLVQLRRRCFEQQVDAFVRGSAGGQQTTLIGWAEFERLVGPDAASRREYAMMYRANRSLIDAAFADAPTQLQSTDGQNELKELLEAHASHVQHLMSRGGDPTRNDSPTPAILAVFCVATASPEAATARTNQLLTQTARGNLSQVVKQSGARGRVARRLLTEWIITNQTEDLYVLSQLLQLADRLELRGVAPLAVGVATGERVVNPCAPQFRATALLIAGRLGSRSDIPALAPLLEDTAVCSLQAGRGGGHAELLDVQIRDAALAVILHLAGESPTEFGFEKATRHPERLFVLRTLAFRDEQQREVALARWREQPAFGPGSPDKPVVRIAEQPGVLQR